MIYKNVEICMRSCKEVQVTRDVTRDPLISTYRVCPEVLVPGWVPWIVRSFVCLFVGLKYTLYPLILFLLLGNLALK